MVSTVMVTKLLANAVGVVSFAVPERILRGLKGVPGAAPSGSRGIASLAVNPLMVRANLAPDDSGIVALPVAVTPDATLTHGP